ncbi:MAG TPA: ABC transporter permease [Candidatus Aminicenantes bacterium]|nr:ABC transporter permease [Candidatus Aminicenantes bacterium]
MNTPWLIARLDLKRMLKDKAFFFWSLAFPVFLILIFGNLYQGNGSDPKAELVVVNRDQGHWGEYLVAALDNPDMVIQARKEKPQKFTRILEIPADFSQRIQSLQSQKLRFTKNPDASLEAATRVETRIIQALVRLIAGVVLQPEPVPTQPEIAPLEELVSVKAGFPAGTITSIPSGFDHVIPGILVHMLMILILIYGGITVMIDRQSGILTRIISGPVSRAELWKGKFLGRLLVGLLQAVMLMGLGLILFKLNLGNPTLSFLIILLFSATMASLSIFLGSVFRKEEVIIGLAILFANLFAALGGCWWPIEVVPPVVRAVGMVVPAWWAMDAFHKVIFFHKGLETLWLHYTILLGYTALFSFLAVRYFKIRE